MTKPRKYKAKPPISQLDDAAVKPNEHIAKEKKIP
jgi:hypothetical protein